jgi:hypothetical protein
MLTALRRPICARLLHKSGRWTKRRAAARKRHKRHKRHKRRQSP